MPNPVGFQSPPANPRSPNDLGTSQAGPPARYIRWTVQFFWFLGMDLSGTAWGTQMRKHLVEVAARVPEGTPGDQALVRIMGQIKSLEDVDRLMPGRSAKAVWSYIRLLSAHTKYSGNEATLDMCAVNLLQDSDNLARKFDFESVLATTLREVLGKAVRTGNGATLLEFSERFKRCAEQRCVGIVGRANLEKSVNNLAAEFFPDANQLKQVLDITTFFDLYLPRLNEALRVAEVIDALGVTAPRTFDPLAHFTEISTGIGLAARPSDHTGEFDASHKAEPQSEVAYRAPACRARQDWLKIDQDEDE